MSGGGLTGKSAIREAHYALFLCRRPIKMSPVCRLGMAPPSGVLWARFGECGTVVFPKRGKRSIFRCEQIRNRAICRECDHHLRFPSTSRFCRIFSRLGGKKFPVMRPREFAHNPLTKQARFRGRTAAAALNRRNSRLFSRFTGIAAAQ